MTRAELWEKLVVEGVVEGEMPEAAPASVPWPVRVMLGVAGWIGALFLLAFAGAAVIVIFTNAAAALPCGLLCCGAAYGIFKRAPRNDFVAQFGFAMSLAGQVLLLVGLFELAGKDASSVALFAMAFVEAGLAVAVPNYLHRVVSTIAGIVCLLVGGMSAGLPMVATAVAAAGCGLIWLDRGRMAEQRTIWEPLGYGFAISLLHVDGSLLMGGEFWGRMVRGSSAPEGLMWMGGVTAGGMLVYAVWVMAGRVGADGRPRVWLALAAAVVVALAGLPAPGLSAAVLVIILGFGNSDRVLMGLGLVALGGYLSHFYYQLNVTLLVKSMVLVGTGVALLGMRWGLRVMGGREEATHA